MVLCVLFSIFKHFEFQDALIPEFQCGIRQNCRWLVGITPFFGKELELQIRLHVQSAKEKAIGQPHSPGEAIKTL